MVTILHQDEFCLIVSKPNDVLVHHAHHSRNKADEDSLLQLLEKQLGQKFYPIHRLDRKTSGVILLATKTEYVSKFQELFTSHNIAKIYYGMVRGFAPDNKVVNTPVKGRDANVYKDALTHLSTLETVEINEKVGPYNTARYSLVKLEPKTGRLHQLRIHTSKISYPLINDPKYGDNNHNRLFEEKFKATHLFLHAGQLQFQHPFTEQNINVKATFPKDWLTLFTEFKWNNPLF